MDEAKLCERIALIQTGQVMSINTPRQLIAQFPEPLLAVKSTNMIRLLRELRALPFVKTAYAFGEHHHLTLEDPRRHFNLLQAGLHAQGHEGLEITTIEPTIEDCFIRLMAAKNENSHAA